jgi:hypothetical protein
MSNPAPVRGREFSLAGIEFDASRPWENLKKNRKPRICLSCAVGDHSYKHKEIGCLVVIGEPNHDYVCDCEMPGSAS